jgi:hypothetical protein
MKGPAANPYQGSNLNNQTAGAFSNALGATNDAMGIGRGALQGAEGAALGAGQAFGQGVGQMPSDVTAGQLSGANLQPYMNPFQQNVIDTTMGELNRQGQIGLQGVDDAMMQSRSFGGDRHAVERAEMRRNMDQQRQSILAQLNSQNFQNAQNMGTADINRKFAADQGNQGVRAGMWGQGAQGLAGLAGNLGQFGQSMYDPSKLAQMSQQGFNFADTIAKNNLQAGTLQQQQVQQMIDAAKMQWEQFTNQPLKGLSAITGATTVPQGYGKTTENPGALGILGAGISGLGALAGICDRRLKEDILELGVEPESGLKVYAFRYKGDPKSYTKVVGYMADEVEAAYPGTTIEVGGFRAILNDKLAQAIKEKAHARAA